MNNEQGGVEIKYGIADILCLIPSFSGEKDEIEFIYFREGCRDALRIIGPKNDKLLMTFLKTKLKGDAFTRFALRLSTYQNIYQFLRELKKVYAPQSDEPVFWKVKMMELRQKNEPMHKCGARMQELIQCAIFGVNYVEPKSNVDNKPKQNLDKEREERRKKELEREKFIAEESRRNAAAAVAAAAAGNTKYNKPRPLSFKTIMQIINTIGTEDQYLNDEVTLRRDRGRREKPLSIKGTDYPKIEYPTSPVADHKVKPNYDGNNEPYALKTS